MNPRHLAIFALVVAAVVGTALYFLLGEDAPHTVEPAVVVAKKTAPQEDIAESPTQRTLGLSPDAVKTPDPEPAPAPPPAAPVITEDDRKIDDVLKLYPGNTDADIKRTAQALINLLPGLTKDGQVECAGHITNLLADEDWQQVNHIWRNPAFNPDVLDVFHADLMNRDDKVKLPALLDAIKMPNHPAAEEAKTTMEIFLDGDYGNDMVKWEAAMKKYLAEQAAEEAANQ